MMVALWGIEEEKVGITGNNGRAIWQRFHRYYITKKEAVKTKEQG